MCIGLAVAFEPLGPYVSTLAEPLVCQQSLGGSIAPEVIEAFGQTWLLWNRQHHHDRGYRNGHLVLTKRPPAGPCEITVHTQRPRRLDPDAGGMTGRPRPSRGAARRTLTARVAIALLVAIAAGCVRWAPSATAWQASARTADAAASSTTTSTASITTTSMTTTTTTQAPTALELETAAAAFRLAGSAPGTCTTVTYTPSTARRPQVGDLCLPTARTTDTVVLLVHGGGGTEGSRTDLRAWQHWYQVHGVTTLNIDYRLATKGTDTGVYPEPEQDVKAAVQFLHLAATTLGTDAVVLQGHSAGARLGAIVLTTAGDDAFTGSALWHDVSDAIDGFIGFYGYYDGFQFDWQAYYGGDASFPAAADSLERADDATGPVLLVHGTDDALVHSTASTDLASRLRAVDVDVDLDLLDGLQHGFDLADGQMSPAGRLVAAQAAAWLQALGTARS